MSEVRYLGSPRISLHYKTCLESHVPLMLPTGFITLVFYNNPVVSAVVAFLTVCWLAGRQPYLFMRDCMVLVLAHYFYLGILASFSCVSLRVANRGVLHSAWVFLSDPVHFLV